MSKILSAAEVKEQFTDLMNHVNHHKERVIVTRRGKEVAAIIPIEDLYFLQQTHDHRLLNEALDALTEVRQQGSIPLETFKAKVGVL